MKDQVSDETIVDRLELARSAKVLPKAARDHADHLLKRLSSPVRVTLFGKPGSGKSELINMFAGRRIIPKDAKLPTTELVYGENLKVTMTTTEGGLHSFDDIDLGSDELARAAFIKVALPLSILKRINFLEVVTDGSANELGAAVDWAVKRTDIALWCAQDFDAVEQKTWARVPDVLKDHAFLVLSKADILSANKLLSKRIAALESVVSEEFHSLFAVATLQALKAQNDDGTVDEALRNASGGGALSSEILRHAERGRRADIDSAELFLARYRLPIEKAAPKTDEPVAVEPAPEIQEAKAVPLQTATTTEPKSEELPAKSESATNVVLFSDASQFLRRRGDNLLKSIGENGAEGGQKVVSQCVDAVEHLIDLFSQDDSGCKAADSFIDDLMEATDLMVLMQSETGEDPPADAVTILLQLRREMDEKIAA